MTNAPVRLLIVEPSAVAVAARRRRLLRCWRAVCNVQCKVVLQDRTGQDRTRQDKIGQPVQCQEEQVQVTSGGSGSVRVGVSVLEACVWLYHGAARLSVSTLSSSSCTSASRLVAVER